MFAIKYQCGMVLMSKANSQWARVDDADGNTVYEGTWEGAHRWLADHSIKPVDRRPIMT